MSGFQITTAPALDLAAVADYLIAASIQAATRKFVDPETRVTDVLVVDNLCAIPTGRFTKTVCRVRLRCTRDEYGLARFALEPADVRQYLADILAYHRQARLN